MNILPYSHVIRIVIFMTVLCSMMFVEWKYPRRKRRVTRLKRWPHNLLIVLTDSFLVRLLFPVLAVGAATYASINHIGIMNLLSIPYPIQVIMTVLMLDFMIYWQHVLFHRHHLLWRFHRMHHTDLDIDVTTGLRFHPVEILISMLIKIVAVLILGAPALGVLIFEILLNATALFNHSNLFLPVKLDRMLRLFLVTPDMHRVHHSIIMKETNSNYGFNLPWWDRFFRTYIDQPTKGHDKMTIGLNIFRQEKYLKLGWLLLIPFIDEPPEQISSS